MNVVTQVRFSDDGPTLWYLSSPDGRSRLGPFETEEDARRADRFTSDPLAGWSLVADLERLLARWDGMAAALADRRELLLAKKWRESATELRAVLALHQTPGPPPAESDPP